MNLSLGNSYRRIMAAMVLAIASMSMSHQAFGEETSPADTPRASTTEKAGFCYQGDEMISCERAAKDQQEAQGQDKATQPPRMFDLDVLLGGNPS